MREVNVHSTAQMVGAFNLGVGAAPHQPPHGRLQTLAEGRRQRLIGTGGAVPLHARLVSLVEALERQLPGVDRRRRLPCRESEWHSAAQSSKADTSKGDFGLVRAVSDLAQG